MHIVLFSVPEASAAAAGAEPGAPGGRHALHPGALQLAPVLGGDQRHRRPRRLRPGGQGGGLPHEGGPQHQVRSSLLLQTASHFPPRHSEVSYIIISV